MAKQIIMARDKYGNTTYGPQFPEVGYNFLLAVGTNQSLTIPEGYNFVIFAYSGGTDVFVNVDAAAVLPTTPTPVSSIQQLNPQARWLTGTETTLQFICDTTSYIQVSFYTVPELS